MTDGPEYPLAPRDHAELDEALEALAEAAELLGRSHQESAPPPRPSDDAVLNAGDLVLRAIEGLVLVQSDHADEDEQRAAAAAIRASESATLDQWGAEHRDRA